MADTKPFTIRLPDKVIEMIEEDLVPVGLYGTNRAEACRALIISRLEELMKEGIVRLRRPERRR